MDDTVSDNTVGDSEQENEDINSEIPVPKIVKQDAIRLGISFGIMAAISLLMIKIMDDFYDMGYGISPDGILWVSIAIAFGAGGGFVLGVLYGDRYGIDVEVWRGREQEREQYEQSEEYAQRMAEANHEYKKSDFYRVFKIWMGFCVLMSALIFAIGIFS